MVTLYKTGRTLAQAQAGDVVSIEVGPDPEIAGQWCVYRRVAVFTNGLPMSLAIEARWAGDFASLDDACVFAAALGRVYADQYEAEKKRILSEMEGIDRGG